MRKTERPEGFDKLPQRFKAYAARLEAEIYSLNKALPTADLTLVRIVDNAARHAGRPEQYLPSGTEIAFCLDAAPPKDPFDGRWILVKLTDTQHGTALEVRSDADGLALYPSVSNVAFIKTAERRVR